jgi:hypothetical protein
MSAINEKGAESSGLTEHRRKDNEPCPYILQSFDNLPV